MEGIKGYFIFLVMMATIAIFVVLLISGEPADGMTPGWRAACLTALGIAGFGYYKMRQKAPKRLLGIFSIIIGALSSWIQLGKLTTVDAYDRLAFLAAGVAVMAQGFKEVIDAKEP